MRKRLAVLLLFCFLPLSLTAHAQQDNEAARRTIEQIEQLLKQRPTDAVLWFFLARFRADLGDVKGAIAALDKTSEHGDGYLPTREFGFARAWDDPAFKAAHERIAAKLPRLDFAPTAFELEDRALIPEGIAYDPRSRNFFVGSIAKRNILRVDAANAVTEFAGAAAGMDAVLGIAVDGPRRRLYAVSTSALTIEGEKRLRNAVVAFDVDTGRLLQRFDVPAARQLNDVAVGLGGRVFASDSVSGAIFELNPEGGLARQLLAPDQLRGSNGLAASPDAKRLYVAHSTGLAMIDTASGAMKRVVNRTRENIAAIDGLYEYQGELIGVQNVTSPGRVILMSLSRNGEEVTGVRTLLSHHHSALFEPTTGAVAAGTGYFYLLAATAVTRFNRAGTIDAPETIPNPVVLRVLLPR